MSATISRIRQFIPPMSIVLFLVLTAAGTYYVRKGILEKHMSAAMDMNDEATIAELMNSWPCPVNARDKDSGTLLHRAAAEGRIDLMRRLLSKGADINAKDKLGETPLVVAYMGWKKVPNPAGRAGPPGFVYLKQRKEAADFLIAEGADVNARGMLKATLLHWSIREPERVKLLLAHGADVDAKDVNGSTPLYMAAISGNAASAEILIAARADVNARAGNGWTPLRPAAAGGFVEIVKLLLARGAEVDAKDIYGETPLTWASWYGHKEVVELLLAKGADVNAGATGKFGKTPLHRAAHQGQREIVELLISKGADVNARDKTGVTPLAEAIKGNHEDVAEVLRKAGAK